MAAYDLDDDQLAGNEADSHNIYEKKYNESVQQAKSGEEAAAQAGGESTDENRGGDNDDDEDKDNVVNREQAPKKPKKDDEDDNPMQPGGKKSRFKGSGSTIAGGGIIVFIGGILVSMASGSSFLGALEKQITTDGDDAGRTNSLMHRAYNKFITVNTGCTGKKFNLKCKMKTLTEKGMKKIQAGAVKLKGLVFKSDGTTRGSPGQEIKSDDVKEGDRVNVQEMETDDGKTVKSGAELNSHLDSNTAARSKFSRIIDPIRSSFLTKAYAKKISSKFGISKKGATAEEKDVKKGTSEEDLKKATAAMDEKANSTGKKIGRILKGAAMGSWSSTLTEGVNTACTLYVAAKVAVAGVKAYWAIDLIRFAYPYFRLISKIIDGSATNEDYDELQSRFMLLTDYMPKEKAKELKNKISTNTLSDSDKEYLKKYGINSSSSEDQKRQIDEVVNKNAFDAQGIRTLMFGDASSLGDMAKLFGVGALGSVALTTNSILTAVQSAGGLGDVKAGKQNLKSICKTARALSNAQNVEGLAESATSWGKCLVGAIETLGLSCVDTVIKTAWGVTKAVLVSIALAEGIKYLTEKILNSNLNIELDMRGPAAGSAIASGMALMLARKSQGSGLKPSMSVGSVKNFITSTQETYNKYGDEVARYDARSDPFNMYNRYSFLGTLMDKLVPYPIMSKTQLSGFSLLSNLFTVSTSVFGNSVSALHSSPSLLTIDDATLKSRTNNGDCEVDNDKGDTGMVCDRTTGRAIMITSPRVLQWAQEDASGKTDHMSEAIDWMSQDHTEDEGSGDGSGTRDETCSWISSMSDLEIGITDIPNIVGKAKDAWGKCGESSKKSIDEDGKVQPGSQFEKFIKYCTDERSTEMGSSDEDPDKGSDKDQWWADGSQCALTYDKAGHKSTSNDFDPKTDTGNGSLMMDYFNYYYNMCYVQYSMMNDATDCTNDSEATEAGGTPAGAGNGSIVDSANLMGGWSKDHVTCYKQERGHDKAWMDKAIENQFSTMEYATDCSEFVRIVIYHATGNDVGEINTDAMCSGANPNFKAIPRSEAQPGDFTIEGGSWNGDKCSGGTHHTEVIVGVNSDGTFATQGSHSPGCGQSGNGPAPSSYSGSDTHVIRYVGPGKS